LNLLFVKKLLSINAYNPHNKNRRYNNYRKETNKKLHKQSKVLKFENPVVTGNSPEGYVTDDEFESDVK